MLERYLAERSPRLRHFAETTASLAKRALALEPEVPLGEALASYPYLAFAVDEIHPQLQLEKDVEAQLMEETNRLDVAADRANLDRSCAALTSGGDDRRHEQPADPSVSMLLVDYDGLQL